jgi:divalent metal cation (Fe/Co/Zn/Cd) transporter
VGLNIVWTAFQLLRRSYEGLMERVDAEEALAVEGALATARDEGLIRDFHHLRHRRVNDQVWIETHLLFADGATLADAHTRASRAEARLRALFPKDRVLITTHLEPESHPHPEGSGHDDVLDAGAS